ncbi:MAG: hypothetical protein ACRD5K_17670 [Candidatus Acidiferrales bacterium]
MTDFAAYFDDSGHPDGQKAVIVAGFIASEEQWLLFEKEWKAILAPLSIDLFHMADFENCKVWPKEFKMRVVEQLVSTIVGRCRYHISEVVLMDDYRRINDLYAFQEVIGTPYALAGRTVAKCINQWKKNYTKPSDKLLVFFEDGTKHKGDFMDAMERDGVPCPQFLGKGASPLQAADLLAWEILNTIRTDDTKRLKRFKHHPGDDGVYHYDDLQAICRDPRVPMPRRDTLNPSAYLAHHSSPKKPRRRTIK